jgi:hypothetical protein
LKRFALAATIVLLCPCLSQAQNPTTGLMVGPNAPIVVDTDGDGIPEPGSDVRIVPTFDGQQTLTVPNPWEQCGPGTHNQITMTGGPPFTGGTRNHDTETESVQATEYDGVRPTDFTMFVDRPTTDKNGTAGVVDENNDGIYDAFQGAGTGGINFLLDFVYADTTGDGWGDYVSIPWSQASALGVDKTDGCGPGPNNSDPQIFVPLADTTGDGLPDSIVLDLDGNGLPDQQFRPGPIMGAAAAVALDTTNIPTLGEWGAILAMAGLAVAAWMQIRSNGLGA